MEQNNQKTSYSRHAFHSPAKDAPLSELVGYIEGFAKKVTSREVTTKNGTATVTDVDVNVIMPDSRVEKLFGESFINDYHSVRFRVSYWNLPAQQIAKYPPQENQKVLMLITGMKTDESTGKDGKTYRTVLATGSDYMRTNSPMKDDGVSAVKGSHQNAESVDASDVLRSKNFEVMEDFSDDGELPF